MLVGLIVAMSPRDDVSVRLTVREKTLPATIVTFDVPVTPGSKLSTDGLAIIAKSCLSNDTATVPVDWPVIPAESMTVRETVYCPTAL